MYSIGRFQAYTGHFDSSFIEKLKIRRDVAYIEADQIITTSGYPIPQSVQQDAPLGLNMISHRSFSSDYDYVYHSSAGSGVYTYIIDSGINSEHNELFGRVRTGFIARGLASGDRGGHGTHIAALVGGTTYGVAKRAMLVSVKVVEYSSGSAADLLDGFVWAYKDITLRRLEKKAVINISIQGGDLQAMNDAIDEAAEHKVTTVVAAGNNNEDVSNQWTTERAIVVAATDNYHRRARMSNYGSGITLFAPGVNIRSAWKGSRNAAQIMSGTSQAAAYVAGIVTLLKGRYYLPSARGTKGCLERIATKGSVTDLRGSPDLFAYNGGNGN
ncbi:alkaline protease [Myriangium duriaei CBS 260.36]|uniref:Alkaline protease n=1 Tax=Myriangium duriaei CBS 260.36 TaxID=1168546 RepID=A0A9P4MT87_9PEZI|nr:alkaline protease [Myriangium duriaei CBS 260.36]